MGGLTHTRSATPKQPSPRRSKKTRRSKRRRSRRGRSTRREPSETTCLASTADCIVLTAKTPPGKDDDALSLAGVINKSVEWVSTIKVTGMCVVITVLICLALLVLVHLD